MADPATIRSFVAIDVEPPVRAALCAVQSELTRIKADVRWVRPEGLHATLKFLGAVEPRRVEELHAALGAALAGAPALRVRTHGLGAFPSLRRPRVLWVGLNGQGLVELAGRIDTALSPLGFEAEKRGFTPHITLGRVNSQRGWPRLEEVFKAHLDDDFGDSDINGVTIYRSTLQPGGAVYTPLWTIPLGQNKEGVSHDTRR